MFIKIALITLVFYVVPTAQAFNLNAVALNKALSAPVQKLWPNAAAFVVTAGLATGTFMRCANYNFAQSVALGVGCSAITLALLKGAHYSGNLYVKMLALCLMPTVATAIVPRNKPIVFIAGFFSTGAAIAAAHYVK